MDTYRVEKIVPASGKVTLKVPFRAGAQVEVTVRSCKRALKGGKRYPLRGKPIRYIDPFKSVAERDWDILK